MHSMLRRFVAVRFTTSMLVVLIVVPKCRLTASHIMLPLVSDGEYADGTVIQTDGRMDARPLHYAFGYGRSQRYNQSIKLECWQLTC